MKKQKQTTYTSKTILAAPQSDYMSAAQLEFFRLLLEEERNKLLRNAQDTLDHMQEITAEPDPNDRASTEEEFSLELQVRGREGRLMKKIEEALTRIKNETYGWCEETGESIGIPRLLARPTATLCIEAQERRELQKRIHGW